MSNKPKLPPKETNTPPSAEHREASKNAKEKQSPPWWKKIDQTLLSTIALTIISLCALFVSIYQTRVLSLQQEVMAEQQRIMTENAKAQLWPNIEIERSRSYDRNGTIEELYFNIGNTGTGPAIIEGVTVQYEGKYAKSWGSLFKLSNLSDTIPQTRDNAGITNRVFQAGQGSVFLSLGDNQPLMEHFAVITDNESFTVTVCYRSVFNDYWTHERKFGPYGFDRTYSVDSCTIADSIAFTE